MIIVLTLYPNFVGFFEEVKLTFLEGSLYGTSWILIFVLIIQWLFNLVYYPLLPSEESWKREYEVTNFMFKVCFVCYASFLSSKYKKVSTHLSVSFLFFVFLFVLWNVLISETYAQKDWLHKARNRKKWYVFLAHTVLCVIYILDVMFLYTFGGCIFNIRNFVLNMLFS